MELLCGNISTRGNIERNRLLKLTISFLPLNEVKVRVFDFHFLEYRLASAAQFFQMDCFNSSDPLWQFDNVHNFFA